MEFKIVETDNRWNNEIQQEQNVKYRSSQNHFPPLISFDNNTYMPGKGGELENLIHGKCLFIGRKSYFTE